MKLSVLAGRDVLWNESNGEDRGEMALVPGLQTSSTVTQRLQGKYQFLQKIHVAG